MNMLSQQNPQNIFQRERYVYVCVYIYLMCIYMYMTYINTHRWHKKKPHTDTPLTWAGISGLISSLATTPPLPALRLQLPGSGPLSPLQTHSLQGESVTVVYRVLSHMLLPVTTPKATFPYSRARTRQHPLQHLSSPIHTCQSVPPTGEQDERGKNSCALLPKRCYLKHPTSEAHQWAHRRVLHFQNTPREQAVGGCLRGFSGGQRWGCPLEPQTLDRPHLHSLAGSWVVCDILIEMCLTLKKSSSLRHHVYI